MVYNYPEMTANNLMMGTVYIDYHGPMNYVNLTTNDKGMLMF